MKVRDGFMLREIAGSWIVVPIGQRVVEFNGLMTLSESGALIWRKLENDVSLDDLVQSILDEYNVDAVTARADVQELIEVIEKKGLIA